MRETKGRKYSEVHPRRFWFEKMESGVMEELRICREERDILRQKLHIHLDRWTLDKIILKERAANAARDLRLKEAQQSYEISRREMRIGSQQQQLLVVKLKLDSAMEDVELKEAQLSALKSQLQEERRWLHYTNKQLEETKASFSKKLASKKSKLVVDMERKIHHLQKVVDDRARSHKTEIEQIEGKHALAVTQLREEIKQLISRDDDMKAKQSDWILERKQLQAVLAQERDNLRAEQEQWHIKELHAVLQEREQLRGELEEWKLKQKEMQAVIDERDILIAEKACFISRDEEMIEVLKERDSLNVQLEHHMSRGHDAQVLKERDEVQHELDQSKAKRQEEVSALVRERDFVWSQMKKLDEDYGKRIKKMSEKNLQVRQEIERLSNELKGAQVGHNEIMVEMTLLKLEAKQVEDLAIQKQRALEAELQELKSRLGSVEEEKQTLIADALKKKPRLSELISRTETLDRQLDSSYQDQVAGAVADGVKDGPEVLNAGDGATLDHEILESQIEHATQVQRNDQRISATSVNDLTRENENLRRENENLRSLYAEAEDALRKKPQKPAKVIYKANHRDPTSRNLKLELEAAATSSPSDERPITNGIVRRKGKKKRPGKQNVVSSSNSSQTKKNSSSKSGRDGDHSSENVEGSKRKTRNSKGMSLSSSKFPSDENAIIPSPKNLRPRSRVDYTESGLSVDQKDQKPVTKKRRKVDEDFESIQNPRPPLHALPHNQRSSSKSAVRTSSSTRGPHPESGKKICTGSPTKTSKMMANLFSTAFSVPKLKNVQTPAHFMT